MNNDVCWRRVHATELTSNTTLSRIHEELSSVFLVGTLKCSFLEYFMIRTGILWVGRNVICLKYDPETLQLSITSELCQKQNNKPPRRIIYFRPRKLRCNNIRNYSFLIYRRWFPILLNFPTLAWFLAIKVFSFNIKHCDCSWLMAVISRSFLEKISV